MGGVLAGQHSWFQRFLTLLFPFLLGRWPRLRGPLWPQLPPPMRRYGFGLAGLQVRIPSFCTASHWGPYPRLRPVPRCVVLLLLGAFQHFDAEPSKAVVWGSLEALCQVLVFRSPRFSWHLLDPIDLIIFRWCPILVRFFHPISIF